MGEERVAYMEVGHGFPEWPDAIELENGARPADGRRRYVPERTCAVVGTWVHHWFGGGTTAETELSCGHVLKTDEVPAYCPECGARVVGR